MARSILGLVTKASYLVAVLVIGAAATLALLTFPQAGMARTTTAPPALEAAIAESHEALRKILNGDPSGYAALFADREDITLGNPFGPFGKGRAAVLAARSSGVRLRIMQCGIKTERSAVRRSPCSRTGC